MQLSIFEVLGPVMIGPSSSHTAGAAKLARVAALIVNKPFDKVWFGLSGSFASTGLGHGTHKALLAGALGLREDDERIRVVEQLAAQRGVRAEFGEEELEGMHENSVHIRFFNTDGTTTDVWGSSIGGGRILVKRIGGFATEIAAEAPTLVVHHIDRTGAVSEMARVFARHGINIAVMRLSREAKGQAATLVAEVDGEVPPGLVEGLRALDHVMEVIFIDVS